MRKSAALILSVGNNKYSILDFSNQSLEEYLLMSDQDLITLSNQFVAYVQGIEGEFNIKNQFLIDCPNQVTQTNVKSGDFLVGIKSYDGTIMFGSYSGEGIYILKNGQFERAKDNNGLEISGLFLTALNVGNLTYFGGYSDNGIYVNDSNNDFNKTSITSGYFATSVYDSTINSAYFGSGANGGIKLLKNGVFSQTNIINGKFLTSVSQQDSLTFFGGYSDNGIAYSANGQDFIFIKGNGYFYTSTVDKYGNIYIGSGVNEGILRYSISSNRLGETNIKTGAFGCSILSSSEIVYFGSDSNKGLFFLNSVTGNFDPVLEVNQGNFRFAINGLDGSTYFCSNSNQGIWKVKDGIWTHIKKTGSFSSGAVADDGTIYFGSYLNEGIWKLEL